MFNNVFWKDTAERVVVTMAQAFLAVMLSAEGFDLFNTNWKATLSVVLTAGLLSVLKAVVAGKFVDSTVSPASLASDHRGV